MTTPIPTGKIKYALAVDPMKDRAAFDGTVPYGVECFGSMGFWSQAAAVTDFIGVFSLVGEGSVTGYDYLSDESRERIVRKAVFSLSDFWFEVSGVGTLQIMVAICDPRSEFPTAPDSIHLYDFVFNGIDASSRCRVNVPDLERLILPASAEAPLNIVVFWRCPMAAGNSNMSLSYHCLTTLDD